MNKSCYSFFITLLLLSLIGCDKNSFNTDAEILLPNVTPKLVLWSAVTNTDTVLTVKLSKSASVNIANIALTSLSNATVLLWKDGQIYRKLTYQPKTGIYTAPIVPIGESKSIFKLTASAEGYESVSATQNMPTNVPLANYTTSFLRGIPVNNTQYEFTAQFTDPNAERNYYRVSFTEVIKRKAATRNTEVECKILDKNLVSGKSIYASFLQDDIFNGKTCALNYTVTSNLGMDDDIKVLKIHFATITKDSYLYNKSRANYDLAVGNPFAEPVLIHSNIENGYGLFSMENKQVIEIKP